MLTTLDFGQQVDLLNKSELSEALAEDARLRAIVAGVKSGDLFLNSGTPGMGVSSFSTSGTPPQGPAQGFVWAVMNIGFELSASSNVRIWKGVPPGLGTAPIGAGRFVGITSGAQIAASAQFSKGQFFLRAGDQASFVAFTGGSNILSIFLTYIEVPSERIGELLI